MYSSSSAVKNKILEVVRTYRNLSVLGTQVKIESLKEKGSVYLAKGEYVDSGFLQAYEQGTFEISLSAKDLRPVAVSIHPKKH